MSALSTGVFGESREVFLELNFRSGPSTCPNNLHVKGLKPLEVRLWAFCSLLLPIEQIKTRLCNS